MGFAIPDGICNTGLGLGLIRHERQENCSSYQYHHDDDHQHPQEKNKKVSLKYDHIFPSLTLGLPQEEIHFQTQISSPGAVLSSFSDSSVKKVKEREFGGGEEELEVERISLRVSDEDEGSRKRKLRLTKQQSAIFEDNFKEHSTLNTKQKQALAEQLNLRPRQVEVWFQNRRARSKLKQTEVDCEVLKKCRETLTEENKRLQKELQELKSLNGPMYMRLPSATLTMCPSCERTGDNNAVNGVASIDSMTTEVIVPNPQLYTPFSHPSAAC